MSLHRLSRTVLAALLASAPLAVLIPGVPVGALQDACYQEPVPGAPVTCTYTFTGAAQQFVVPAGVTTITVEAVGGQGGDARVSNGGLAARVVGQVPVAQGQTLTVMVAGGGGDAPHDNGGGTPGWNGGGPGVQGYNIPLLQSYGGAGGGGATDVRTGPDLADRVVVAAGGGGAADRGNGGAAGQDGTPGDFPFVAPGLAGTQVAGGAGGVGGMGYGTGQDGSLGAGGAAADPGAPPPHVSLPGGGGGGGGLYGGGGGSAVGPGGGGSSLVPAGGTMGVADAPATVAISYLPSGPATAMEVRYPMLSVGAGVDAQFQVELRNVDGALVPGEVSAQPDTPVVCTDLSCVTTVAGTYQVLFTDDLSGLTGSGTMHVEAGEIVELRVTPAGSTIGAGSEQEYRVIGTDDFGNEVDLTDDVTYAISDGSCTGNRCTGPAGDHVVTATYECLCVVTTATAILHVTPGPTTFTTTTTTTTPATTSSTVGPVVDDTISRMSGPPPAAVPDALARTGSGMGTTALAGGLVLLAGVALVWARRRLV